MHVVSATGHPDDLVVSAHDVSVELGGLPVLRGVSLAVRAAETVALLGANGSGKSTLVRALLGLVPISRGEVQLFRRPLASFSDWRRVGYVPQRSTVSLSRAKVKEVIAAGRLAHRRPFLPARPSDRQAAAAALRLVGLADRANDELSTLSGGQQQRVLIARALATEPDLLVLDEPIAGVDLEHQQALAEVLATLVARGTAVLVVLHEVEALRTILHRAVVLREGRVAADGPLPDLGAIGGHEVEVAEDQRLLHGIVEGRAVEARSVDGRPVETRKPHR